MKYRLLISLIFLANLSSVHAMEKDVDAPKVPLKEKLTTIRREKVAKSSEEALNFPQNLNIKKYDLKYLIIEGEHVRITDTPFVFDEGKGSNNKTESE